MYKIRLNMGHVITEVKYSLLQFVRNRQSLFFAFLLPVLMMVFAVFLFGDGPGGRYMDYLMPGILGVSIMGPALDVTIGTISRNKRSGALKKLATMPLSNIEWNISRIIAGTIIVLISSAISMAFACLLYGAWPNVDLYVIALLIAGAMLFIGLGTVIARLMKGGESANSVSFTLTLPLMFISGSLFPVEYLPDVLRYCSMLSPLTYINEGLRNSMISGGPSGSLLSLAIVATSGAFILCICILSTRYADN